jgi:hypothetical protein
MSTWVRQTLTFNTTSEITRLPLWLVLTTYIALCETVELTLRWVHVS